MIDLSTETPISLTEAARSLPPGRRSRPVHVSTVLRWILQGVHGIRLEGARVGGRWLTSREALQRFAERLTPSLDTNPADSPRPPATRKRASDRAARELDRIGI
jgi:hypothetical protein